MEDSYKIAIIGQKDIILGFKAIGITAINAVSSEEAEEKLTDLVKLTKTNAEGIEIPEYAIILITEELAINIPEESYKKLTDNMIPSILVIPGVKGTTGFGIKRLGKIVEKAIGSNILKD